MRRILLALTVTTALAVSATAFGQPAHDKDAPKDPGALLEGVTEEVFRVLELILQSIPQYAAPEVLENGDIIIRRIHPKPETPAPAPGNGAPTGKPI
ncbi:MAG: hypothetical protein ACE5FR_05130 [Rhodospirillales bacterium]